MDPISLPRVLVEEYQAQELEPRFPDGQLDVWRRAHAEALAALRASDPDAYEARLEAALVKDFYGWLHRHRVRRSALCLSGGGIRSATFGLGLVQGLARHQLLGRFDYLSTVSGGGFLGGWLSAWLQRARRTTGDARHALDEVEKALCQRPDSPLEPEPAPVRHLRSYSRYMSPRLGLLSADTWTLAATWLRNLILNWLVLVPLIAAVLMIPRISLWLVLLGNRLPPQVVPAVAPVLYLVAMLAGGVAIAYIPPARPSLAEISTMPERWRTLPWFLGLCLLPVVLMAVALTTNWAWQRVADLKYMPVIPIRYAPEGPIWLAFATFGLLLHLGGYLCSRFFGTSSPWRTRAFLGELLVVLVTGLLGGVLTWSVFFFILPGMKTAHGALYTCLATPLLLTLLYLATVLYVGLARWYTSDADREWMARASAWLLIAIFLRTAFSAIVLFGPVLLLEANLWLASSVGGLAGLATLLLGFRATGERAEDAPTIPRALSRIGLRLAAPLFALCFFTLVSLGTTWLLEAVSRGWLGGSGPGLAVLAEDPAAFFEVTASTCGWALVIVLALFVATAVAFSFFIDINRFSLHGLYRDRLVRAYLGASRGEERQPNPFTGFDHGDNLAMCELAGNRPLHVVNMALNLVAGQDLAWQDRKALAFTVSPLHAGSRHLGYRRAGEYARHRHTGRAITLGTAVAISGAAASPNMGYHSSPAITFLLALFNVRLGWWLGNPGKGGAKTFARLGPGFAAKPLLYEALGLTDDQSPHVYLSDGGHFENLALYEMVLRRCHFVVLSDAGHDPDFAFEDLGKAIAKIRIDLGVPIVFDEIRLRPRRPSGDEQEGIGQPTADRPYCALGRIGYSAVDDDAEDGWLLYIKPSLNGSEPLDVIHFARRNRCFPHDPTSNQLFGEQQFECYRSLGSHAMGKILDDLAPGADLADLFAKVAAELQAVQPIAENNHP